MIEGLWVFDMTYDSCFCSATFFCEKDYFVEIDFTQFVYPFLKCP